MHGSDREALTADGGGHAYCGKIIEASGTRMTLAEPKNFRGDWVGAGVFILDGKGAGQYRRHVRRNGDTIHIDRPWAVTPDTTSWISVTRLQEHYLIVGNEFTDTGSVQMWGSSVDCVLAGNTGTRMAGFFGIGIVFGDDKANFWYQPSWYCQFLGNTLREGNYYHWDSAKKAVLNAAGMHNGPYQGPLNLGEVLRNNRLENNATLRIRGASDTLVEGNFIAHTDEGIFVSRDTQNVLLRRNHFEDVARPMFDDKGEPLAKQVE